MLEIRVGTRDNNARATNAWLRVDEEKDDAAAADTREEDAEDDAGVWEGEAESFGDVERIDDDESLTTRECCGACV